MKYKLTIIEGDGREVTLIGRFDNEVELLEWAKRNNGTLEKFEEEGG